MLLCALLLAAPAAQEAPLNVVWITFEDCSPILACYGDETVATPNIDRLAREGIRFDRAFATTGVCAPSRTALITGCYPTRTGAQHMRARKHSSASGPDSPDLDRPLYEAVPPPDVRCFPELLRARGVYCTNNAKTDYQFRAPVSVWDESSRKATWRKRPDGALFFAVFNSSITHESRLFAEPTSPRLVDPAAVRVPAYYPDTPTVRLALARQYDNLARFDARVGEILAQLEEDDLLDSTVVFLFSDHGDGLPRSKRWVYDSGTRVPLLVRFPDGRGAGTSDGRLVSFVDFGPTVLSLFGLETPDWSDGRAFLGEHRGDEREFVFLHRDRMDAVVDCIRAARGPRFRYVRNYRPDVPYVQPLAYRDRLAIMQELNERRAAGTLGADQWQLTARRKPAEELYDTRDDRDEVVNLLAGGEDALDDATRARLEALRTALDEWIEATGDPLAMDEREFIEERIWRSGGQPTTAAPRGDVRPAGGAEGARVRVQLESATEGASIAYREIGSERWIPYAGPIFVSPAQDTAEGAALEAIAHRLGHQPSPTIRIRLR